LTEEIFRVGFLEIVTSNFRTGNLCGDRQHRDTASVAIVESVDQVEISGTTATGTYGQLPREVGFRAGGKRCGLFMPHMNPVQSLPTANRVGDAVEGIAGKSVDALHSRLTENLNEQAGYILRHISIPLFLF
jgi:hypothetical protein